MKYSFVLPSEPFNIKKCDEAFLDLFNEFKERDIKVYLVDIENLDSLKIFPSQIEDNNLIYKGWMLNSEQYELLFKATKKNLIVKPQNYLNSHHSVYWYDNVKEFHAQSFYTTENNAKEDYKKLNLEKAFIKDYVKSLKTGKGSIVDSVEDIDRAIKEMKQYKGYIEGGIVFNEVLDLNMKTEIRTFVLNGKLYSNNELRKDQEEFLHKIVNLHHEYFYSIDIAEDKNGKLYLIEIGDGQVSDLVGWDLHNFVNIFNEKKPQYKLK